MKRINESVFKEKGFSIMGNHGAYLFSVVEENVKSELVKETIMKSNYAIDVLRKEQRSLSGTIRMMEKDGVKTDTEKSQLRELDVAIKLLIEGYPES